METETFLSPILDENIQDKLKSSPIWRLAFKEDEITDEIYELYPTWYAYYVKFQGVTPIQFTKRNIYYKK